MLTAEQVADRVNFLGGSDIALVLGVSQFGTPLKVWGEKTKNIVPEDISNKIQVRFGNKMEPVLSELFEEDTGKKLHRVNQELVHPAYPFLRGHIDRRVVGENSCAEIKTTSAWRSRELEGDQMPADWAIQLMYYMGLGGYDKGYLIYSLGNQEFSFKEIKHDAKVFAEIVRKCADFWYKFVEPKVMPTVIKANDSDVLFKLFPEGEEAPELMLGDEANKIIEILQASQADANLLDDNIERDRNTLKAMLGDSAVAMTDTYKITWKNQITNRFNQELFKQEHPALYEQYRKPSPSRVLRIAKLKTKEKN